MSVLPASAVSETAVVAAFEPEPRYVGLATRAISFAVDALVIDLVALIVGVGAALILSLLHLPHDVKVVLAGIGAVAFILWTVGYFVVFWSTTGQTPGARVMQIRVLTGDGAGLKPRRAILRCGGVLLAALPLFAGFVPILFDERRQGLQDRIARTVVVEAPAVSMAEARRVRKRAEYLAARRPPPPMPGQ
jgi:uncharacterized RDD family membrane protein YckC